MKCARVFIARPARLNVTLFHLAENSARCSGVLTIDSPISRVLASIIRLGRGRADFRDKVSLRTRPLPVISWFEHRCLRSRTSEQMCMHKLLRLPCNTRFQKTLEFGVIPRSPYTFVSLCLISHSPGDLKHFNGSNRSSAGQRKRGGNDVGLAS